MADIRKYIENNLLEPLKQYPTAIQDTMLEIIIERLEELYNYTLVFPEIVSPNSSRLDILKVIAAQFVFTIRDEADIEEQINILNNILYVYSKRGSIDTIENMWKYYGGDLPKEVKVVIPSYNLFRWNISPFSGTHVFQDATEHSTGMYEIRLINSTYSIPKLREFLLRELVAAGNYIYFTNNIFSEIREGTSEYPYLYDITKDDLLEIQMTVTPKHTGLYLSGPTSSALSGPSDPTKVDPYDPSKYDHFKATALWSGRENIYVRRSTDLSYYVEYGETENLVENYLMLDIEALYEIAATPSITRYVFESLYCTPDSDNLMIDRNLYNDKGEHVRESDFILCESLLGEPLGYVPY